MRLVRRPFANVALSAVFVAALFLLFSSYPAAYAQTAAGDTADATALQSQIETRKADIAALEQAIEADQQEIAKLSGQQRTLKNDIAILDATRAKLQREISVTNNRIGIADAELQALGDDIAEKERARIRSLNSLGGTLRSIQRSDDASFVETLLSNDSISDIWEDIDMLNSLQTALSAHLDTITTIKTQLEGEKTAQEKKRAELAAYQSELADQKSVAEYAAKQKDSLLKNAKNQETQYQKLLKEKLAKKEAFEAELTAFEAELRFITDPSLIPEPQHGMLAWPLDTVRLTQEFGDTEFARTHAGVYNGNGHNGVDFGAPIGTPIRAAAGGVVEGTGDTDKVCSGASYGKWVLIRHRNGLSTLYAHLSVIKAQTGTEVGAGQVIGYVGVTGYTTGPHLHFTVYATQGVKIMDRKSKACGGTYTMPVADLRAYLNPMLYLPK